MAYDIELDKLRKEETIDANKILHEYFTEHNIDMKTQIDAPFEFTTLDTIITHFSDLINIEPRKIGKKINNKFRYFKECEKELNFWMDKFKRYMISNKRQSRIEVGEILKALKQQVIEGARSIVERLTGMGR